MELTKGFIYLIIGFNRLNGSGATLVSERNALRQNKKKRKKKDILHHATY